MTNFELYDTAVTKTAINLLSYAKRHDGEIQLKNFNPRDHSHMYIFEVARIVEITSGYKTAVEMGFWKHLFSPKDIRKTKRVKSFEDGIDIESFLNVTFDDLEVTPEKVWKEYYK